MFVAFTTVAVWLGWNVWSVRERRSMLEALGKSHARTSPPDQIFRTTAETNAFRRVQERYVQQIFRGRPYETLQPTTPPHLSKLRAWLGDRPVQFIAYTRGPKPSDVQRQFPEATVFVPAGAR
jgi:hypothetical protein